MKKFLIGLVAGILLCGLTLVIIGLALMRLGERKPTVSEGSTLVLRLEGEVPERPPMELPLPFLESQTPVTVLEVWDTLRKAAADSRVKAVVFMPRGLSIGWSKIEEIRADLMAFRKSGKALVAFLRNPGTAEYYLATAADRIYMTEEDMLDVKGLRVEAMFLTRTLDKIGVKADVEHVGKYKDAGDMFTRSSMTPETREVLNQILDQYYGDLVKTIAEGRKKSPDDVRALIDQGPFLGQDARARGLVDSLAYEEQVYSDLKSRLKQNEIKKVSLRDYLKVPAASAGLAAKRKIALVVGSGAITRGQGNEGPGADDLMTSGGMIKLLRQVEDDASIKGVILRIDSPGGDGIASDDILHEAKVLSQKKPLVISMSDLAASGGYFVAVTGDPIVAYPNTLTGSIGVIYAKFNLRGLYDKLGIQKEALTRGKYASIDSEYQPMNEAERAKVRDQVEAFYKGFVQRVATGRRMKYEQVDSLAQGRVWLGAQARQNGLVDELGGLDKAIELVKKKAQIPASENVTLVPYPQKRSLFDYLLSRSDEAASVEARLHGLVKTFPIEAWMHGGYLKVMPFSIEVH